MSLRATVRALPVLVRTAFAEAVAYRAEMLIWILATTMPLIMMALWSAVAKEAPIGRYGEAQVRSYFLATFIVRQLTGAWAAWQMNFEIRKGILSMRLLRPIHPLWHYGVENLGAYPLRLVVALPMTVLLLWFGDNSMLPRSVTGWAAVLLSISLAWLITFLINVVVGCLAFFMESSTKVMEVWFTAFYVFSGYLIPLDLFPPRFRAVLDLLPFRYQLGLPVELITSAHAPEAALRLLGQQILWAVVLLGLASLLWRRGLKRFAAYGG